MPTSNHNAPGAPGIAPRWTSSAKDGIGTAYHTSSRLWFTLSHGIVNEVYYPHVDTPNTRDLQFLITDGETFCHEEKRDLDHLTEYPEQNALLYRLTNSDRKGRYRIIKEIIGEPHSSVLLMHTRLEILDPKLRGKLRLLCAARPAPEGHGPKQFGAVVRHRRPKAFPGRTRGCSHGLWLRARFHAALRRLRRTQRRLAGLDGQFQDGLGI
jgi:glucoamylase